MGDVRAFKGDVGFNAQHPAPGAYLSFTCGHFGTRGGLTLEGGKPGEQDVFIGVKEGDRYADAPLRCLPFYDAEAVASAEAARYELEQRAGHDVEIPEPKIKGYQTIEIARHYGWASDKWVTPDFEFTLFTPFGNLPSPTGGVDAVPTAGIGDWGDVTPGSGGSLGDRVLPAVLATLTVDNTHGDDTKTAIFSLGFHEPGARILDAGLDNAKGFGLASHLGVAGRTLDPNELNVMEDLPELMRAVEDGAAPEPFVFMRWTPQDGLEDKDNPVHLLGSCPGIGIEVPAGESWTLLLALGGYKGDVVTTRLETRYWYNRYYSNVEQVLNHALTRAESLILDAQDLDESLTESGLSDDQQFLLSHATRSYYGSTQLLELAGQPYWIVNEGEYRMMNTLDLSVDQVFWELRQHPWVVRNLLDNFVRYYSYHDKVVDPETGLEYPGGISFAHDQGVNNQFSPLGRSSYELTALPGCFSHMTYEQLCNFSLCAASYFAQTGDIDWLHRQTPVIRGCLSSLENRDHPDPYKRDGVMAFDSNRCGGPPAKEITTYDSLDESLAQARNNVYIAVKGWATALGLALLFDHLNLSVYRDEAFTQAHLSAMTICKQVQDDGTLPAVFEPDNPGFKSRILPAVEGLVYPLYWRTGSHGESTIDWLAEDGPFSKLLRILRTHTQTLLQNKTIGEGGNHYDDGALKLSSTSNNSWVSKTALFIHVCRHVLRLNEKGQPLSEAAATANQGFAAADKALVRWHTTGTSAYWAMSDQFVNGEALGSKYYPRGVTTALWLELPQVVTLPSKHED